MGKRILAAAMLVCLLSTELRAASWFFNTWVKSGGGGITSRNITDQRVSDGPIFKSYTTTAPLDVTVTADQGYGIRNIFVNNVDLGPRSSPFRTSVQGMTDQAVTATFVPSTVSVSATNQGGTVTPAKLGNIFYGYTLKDPLTFYFVPAAGYQIAGVKNIPSDSRVTHSTFSPGVNIPVTVTFDAGYVFTQPIDLEAVSENTTPSIAPILIQTVVPGVSVTLTAVVKNITAPNYTWSYVSGPGNTTAYSTVNGKISTIVSPSPALVLAGSTSAIASFTAPATPGQYKFRVVASSPGNPDVASLATVNVVSSAYSAGRNQCQFCHSAIGIGPPQLFSNWSASAHREFNVTCDKCHMGANTGFHPGTVSGNVCRNCHVDAQGNVQNHPFAISSSICTACHDPHTTQGGSANIPAVHYNNVTSAGYPASYVTSRAKCADCHYDSDLNATTRLQWAASGHAATTDAPFTTYDFKTMSGCVQCHTTNGFIAYSTGKVTAAWGMSSDKTKELVTCVACHSDITTGAVRTVTPVKPFADDSYLNRNVGESNVCMDCHTGSNNGSSIQRKVGSADFSDLPFVSPHYLTAAGSLQGKSGYHFPGQAYAFYSSNSHRLIGTSNNGTDNGGPCIGCHMTSAAKHSLQAVSRTKTNAITAITAISSSACTNCHGSSLNAATLWSVQSAYVNALEVLKAMLADRGMSYQVDPPFFTNTNWGTDQAGANAMGAAYNYKLLLSEPGAYAHNGLYARKLIADSIDVLFNGTVTGSIESALAYLVSKNAISQEAAGSLQDYERGVNCAICHANTSGSHPAHLRSGIGCAQCHSATAASDTRLVSGTSTHLNGVKDVVFSAGGSYVGGACFNVYCHSDGMGSYQRPVWGGGALNCKSCHPVLTGAHNTHLGDLLGSGKATFSNFTANNSTTTDYRFGCSNCHPFDAASHINGFVEVSLVPDPKGGTLRSKNSSAVVISGVGNTGSGISGVSGSRVTCSAAYCHSNGAAGAELFYATSPDWYNQAGYTGDRCAMCHSNSPGSGAHLAHTVAIHYNKIYDGNGSLILGHGDETQSTTMNCDLCHSATVTNNANDQNTTCTACHTANPVGRPQLDKSRHLNGSIDLSFKAIKVVSKAQVGPASFGDYSTVWSRTSYKAGATSFDTSKFYLSQGTWDRNLRSCSNIACHNSGSPNWNSRLSCIDCHTSL